MEVRAKILEMSDNSVDLRRSDVTICKANVLMFYKRNLEVLPEGQQKLKLKLYAKVVFQLPIETVFERNHKLAT